MKRIVLVILMAVSSAPVWSAGSEYPRMPVNIDLSDKASLQRGVKYFVNYCMGCHSLSHLRYNRVGRDLGLTDRQVQDNLIFTRDDEGSPTKVGSHMTIAMDELYANKVFGVVPPDLTLTARSRGADWIYTYLMTFYTDDSTQWGVNNAMFPNVGMPNVLWELQGTQKAVIETHTDAHGVEHSKVVGVELITPGKLTEEEFAEVARDITNFLAYAAEPAKMFRNMVGGWVIAFLLFVLAPLTYLLKKEYWRDVK